MNRECEWEVEFIPVPISGKDYERQNMKLIEALLVIDGLMFAAEADGEGLSRESKEVA